MSKYSFLVASKESEYFEVNECLRLKKYGGWLVGESIEREEISRAQSQTTLKVVQLAKKISKAQNIELDDAFAILQGGGMTNNEMVGDFADEMLALIAGNSGTEAVNAKIVTAFIRSRGEGQIEGTWQPLSDWSYEDTKELSLALTEKVLEFVGQEQEEGAEVAEKKAQQKKISGELKE
jgi:hypothetical protein